ncbi:MAG TPA: class I SAM-dependent methyltransferase [Gemmatimonadaceae bacterium]|nr:class I SAM-dependent methyltransferase [Gemmatimonadaceae bacterium]
MRQSSKRFDQDYFDRWYRDPRHRIATPTDVRRRVLLATGVAELVLGRRVRSVLDIGCGEATWRAPLVRLRPGVRYAGVDASEYAVRRYGRSRGIRLGNVGDLDRAGLRGKFDIVICADVLHFLSDREVERGLEHIPRLLGGVAYLPTFTSADEVEGDVAALHSRSPKWYRSRFAAAGLVPLGLDFYADRAIAGTLSALELPCG